MIEAAANLAAAAMLMQWRICCEFIADNAIILSLISLLFRRCYPAVLPLISAAVSTDKTQQL
jgi:hypothetical protein